jgi:anti-sigma regulatory factor (Ser/Thr protein kinase)
VELKSSFEVSPRAPAQARRVIDQFDPALPGSVKETLRLVVSELITNAVRHGPVGEHPRINLSLERSQTLIRVEVLDEGDGFPVPIRDPEAVEGHGRGLYIVETVSSAWGVEEDTHAGTKVWAELPVPGP